MLNEFKVIIDNVPMDFFTEFSWSYEWITDAYRNQNGYAIINNPVKKRKVSLKTGKLSKTQFERLFNVIGRTNLIHSVQMYDDFSKTLKTYDMYNSGVSGTKRCVNGNVVYENVSFSLIER